LLKTRTDVFHALCYGNYGFLFGGRLHLYFPMFGGWVAARRAQ
jgi:hypothetical protein